VFIEFYIWNLAVITYWYKHNATNPMTYMANNVAAGSDVSYALFELVSK
jgi:hypothetical protein